MENAEWPQDIGTARNSTSSIMDQRQVRLRHHHKEAMISCPRCNSTNTKFCYYNNYSLSQPRYFCKSCRRYWTQGGSLRNIPVGGGSRKRKSSNTNNNNNNNLVNSSNTQDQKQNTRNRDGHCFKAIDKLIRVPNDETGSGVELNIANATPAAASLGFGVGCDEGTGNTNYGSFQRLLENKLPLPLVHQQNEDATGNLWSGVNMGGGSYW